MKIVAFLQNMWVNDPVRVKRMIAESEHPERLRRHFIHRALFAGCVTGRRIKANLGQLCDTIIWEEASREILGDPKQVPQPNFIHITTVILEEKPDLVIAFGAVARLGVNSVRVPIVFSPHPAARRVEDQTAFREAMKTVLRIHNESTAHHAH